jgi:hypothetical protein
MADSNPTDCGPADADRKAQRVVLAFVLEEHPDRLTIPELCRVLYDREHGFEAEDAVERAVRDLDGAGLLSCPNGQVVPTRAALHFDGLEID